MTLEQFLRNNREINDGEDLPGELLTSIYENVKAEEFTTPPRGKYLNNFNKCCVHCSSIGLWKDISKMKYKDNSSPKEIESLMLLDMNDISKPQITERTGHFVYCTDLSPVLLKYVLGNLMESFLEALKKYKLDCSFVE